LFVDVPIVGFPTVGDGRLEAELRSLPDVEVDSEVVEDWLAW